MPWHLDRISKKNLPLDNSYPYSTKGSCFTNKNTQIHTYIIDTGIDDTHPEFEGRAFFLKNFSGDNNDHDGNGHGTHCAGIIGSKTFGVCKDAILYGIKVLGDDGSGSTSSILSGMEYAYKKHLENEKINTNIRSIINMSLGGRLSFILNRAVETMITKSNTFYIVAASGNENQNACKVSPASAKGIISVMAMDTHDTRASFSNFGKCTDIYGTGVDIESTIPNHKTAKFSGTSMATPQIVGVLNHLLDQSPLLNMQNIKKQMIIQSTPNIIKNNPANTPNRMSYLHR